MAALPVSGPRFDLRLGDSGYPDHLAGTPDPPPVLHGVGAPSALKPALAVVGARKATPYGLSCARIFAGYAALHGLIVVSGGAVGCDQEAQRAALDAGGTVVSVAGCGADVCYPASSASLFKRIVENGGAVVSELPWGSQPRKHTFVRRNRIIAGLACATLIVEAGLGSGTFSTADAALRDGRDVLVVPGSIFSPESMGSNDLLLQGATPVFDEKSFLAALSGPFGLIMRSEQDFAGPAPRDGGGDGDVFARWVVKALTASPTRPDELARSAHAEVASVMQVLSRLELQGEVERYRDGRYGATVDARKGLATLRRRPG